jgi:hypothetical protein
MTGFTLARGSVSSQSFSWHSTVNSVVMTGLGVWVRGYGSVVIRYMQGRLFDFDLSVICVRKAFECFIQPKNATSVPRYQLHQYLDHQRPRHP